MDALVEMLSSLEAWHWIALGLVLIAIEVAVGTYDLLFIGLAALATAAFMSLAPAGMTGWEGQLGFFAVATLVLIVLGRTVFSGMRSKKNDAPNLNNRTGAMVGRKGSVVRNFESGAGRIRIGDSEWSAESTDGSNFTAGDTVTVESAVMTVLKVRLG